MTGKIYRAIMAAVGGVLLASLIIIMGCLYDYFGGVQEQQLADELSLAATGVETSGLSYLESLPQERFRLTWIAADGSVLYDAQADAGRMENHAQREEVQEALRSGEGQSTRYSDTLLERTLYRARLLSDGTVLRISTGQATMALLVMGMLQPVLLVLAAAMLLAFFLARGLSRRIVEPLNRLDLDHPLENQSYDELAPLLRRMDQQNRQIDVQLQALQQKKDELEQITGSMNEGLVLLNESGVLLSINPAAQLLFGAAGNAVGRDFAAVEHSCQVSEALTRARDSGRSELRLERGDRIYQLDISRIESDGRSVGLVLLTFDVTERAQAERSRREFTANVSHELKTPLTSILGSAELLESGLVKPEDTPRFVSHIHREAARLLSLIEDILRLSQLDEGAPLPSQTVELDAVVRETAAQLEEKARQYQVTLRLQTEPCALQSVPRLVHEIAFNLVENAIKYNVPGGTVTVSAANSTLTVTDTGIGIPPEEQDRVFERFYRVDKSHSRQIGGTGLGLSIVKHACAYLGASVSLSSQPGRGTTVCVRFPHQLPADQ